MTAADIAKRLLERKSGSGWMARCSAHDDREPSLSLRHVAAKVLVYCHAGCDQRSVNEALKALGLWPDGEAHQPRRIVAEYSYIDESSELLYQVIRTVPKGFFQRRPDGRGGWQEALGLDIETRVAALEKNEPSKQGTGR